MMDRTAEFQEARPRLQRLAYRMLGSVAEAEDVVQDAWMRWSRAPDDVRAPAAWLLQATARLALDRLKSARARRETYVGPWLPEPLIEPFTVDPVERAEDVSVAFLLALERLSPLERAVFLLHEVFDQDYAEVAAALHKAGFTLSKASKNDDTARDLGLTPDGDAEEYADSYLKTDGDSVVFTCDNYYEF